MTNGTKVKQTVAKLIAQVKRFGLVIIIIKLLVSALWLTYLLL